MTRKKVDFRQLARELQARIEALQPGDREGVIRVFLEAPGKPLDKADAFWCLDNQPGNYPRGHWHSTLRRVRNDPAFGQRLFAIWS